MKAGQCQKRVDREGIALISCGGLASKDKKRGRGLKRSKRETEVGSLQHQRLNDTYKPDSARLPVEPPV